MPLQRCTANGKPGWRYGDSGTCYPYTSGDDASEARAKQKAVKQAVAIGGGTAPADLSERDLASVKLKKCVTCGLLHSVSKFPQDLRTKDGLSGTCVACRFAGERQFAGTTDKAWDGSASRFTDEQYKRSCLIDRGGDASVKERCSLPVLEPDGTINTHALAAAAAVLSSAGGAGSARGNRLANVSSGQIASARSKLKGYYSKAGLDPPENLAEREFATLETMDLNGVPILTEGGPYFGAGSPDEGDTFDTEFLQGLADANNALAREIRVPVKIGHSKTQRLLKNSGLSTDEQPAAGWLENFRVASGQLLADIKGVPKKIADLMESKAFRTRSVELAPVKSQTQDGKEYPAVVTALALLGAKAPAVRTLDDILSTWYGDESLNRTVALLYADEPNDTGTRTVDMAEGDVIWNAEAGASDWTADLQARLNAGAEMSDGVEAAPYYVQDIDQLNRRAIVCDWRTSTYWVVPFALDPDSDPVPAPQESWMLAEQAWVEAANDSADGQASDYAEHLHNLARTEDSETMKDLSTEQIEGIAKLFGIEEADEAKRKEAVVAKMAEHSRSETEPPAPEPAPEPTPTPEPPAPEPTPSAAVGATLSEDERREVLATSKLARAMAADAQRSKVEANVQVALRQGRITPASADEWRKFGERDFDLFIEALILQQPHLELMRAFGSDEKPDNGRGDDAEAFYRAYADSTGVPRVQKEATA